MLEHPAAWRPEELASNPDWCQRWTQDELSQLEAAAMQPSVDAAVQSLAGSAAEVRLLRLREVLEHGCGAAWLQGLDADRLTLDQLRRLFAAACQVVGTPVSQTAQGDLMFDVRDEGFGDKDRRTRGPNTNKRLSFHTDRCDVIAFLCVRNAAAGGDNQLVSSMTLYNDIQATRPDLLAVLQQAFLYQRHNVDQNHPQPYIEQPIFSTFEGHFAANLLRVLIERAYAADDTPAMTSQQREALDCLEALAESPERHIEFRQERGDMVFLNNFVTLHRRTEFTDHQQPELRRHLLRVWLSMPNSRPLDPRFVGNYGNTAAGAIRGGMRGARQSEA